MIRVLQCAVLIFTLTLASSSWSEEHPLDLSRYEGQVVLLDFWASWCGPCRHSFPWLNRMQEKYQNQGLKIVGVNVDADPAEATKFLNRYPADFEIYYDSEGELASRYQIQGMPSSVIIDRNGKVVDQHNGFKKKHEAKYEAKLRAQLASVSSVTPLKERKP